MQPVQCVPAAYSYRFNAPLGLGITLESIRFIQQKCIRNFSANFFSTGRCLTSTISRRICAASISLMYRYKPWPHAGVGLDYRGSVPRSDRYDVVLLSHIRVGSPDGGNFVDPTGENNTVPTSSTGAAAGQSLFIARKNKTSGTFKDQFDVVHEYDFTGCDRECCAAFMGMNTPTDISTPRVFCRRLCLMHISPCPRRFSSC